MKISNDVKLQVMLDHYKDSFGIIREHLKTRERIFLVILTLMSLQLLKESSQSIVEFIRIQTGFEIASDKDAIKSILWFVLLASTSRYFQTNIHIEKQYRYIHALEKKFSDFSGEEIISREGKHYLSKYPLYSKWIGVLYTWVFPILLLVSCGLEIFRTWPGCDALGWPYVFNGVFCLMIFISVILYIGFMKFDLISKKK